MTHNPVNRLCVVCSQSQVPSSKGGGDLLTNPQFSQFCSELEICADDREVDEDDKFEANEFLRRLRRRKDKVSVCSDCLTMISRAVDNKLKLDEVEQEVNKMQVELLRKLKLLKGYTDLYYMEMEGILRRVKQKEGNCLEETKLLDDLTMFKKSIVNVVTELGSFREKVDTKLVNGSRKRVKLSEKRTKLTAARRNRDFADSGAKMETKLRSRQSERTEDTPVTPNSPPEVAFDDDSFQNFDDLEINHDDIDHRNSPDDKGKKVLEVDPLGMAMEETPSNQNAPEPEFIIKEEPQVQYLVEGDMEDDWEVDDDDDSDWEDRKSSKKSKTKHKANPNQFSDRSRYNLNTGILRKVDFSQMTPSRTHLVARILKPFSTKLKHSDQFHYCQYWKYDLSQDQITIANIPISVTEPDPPQVTLHCHHTDCTYTRTFTPTDNVKYAMAMQNRLFDHVLSTHTNLFHCGKCAHKATSLLKFNAHVIHHVNPDSLKCDKCGLLFLKLNNVKQHKKYCTGAKPGSTSAYKGKFEECKTCGQKLPRGVAFQNHLETHLKREDRPKVTCDLCGMTVLKVQFNEHKRNRCPERESKEPIQCDLCGKTFKSPRPSYLKYHQKRVHGIKKSHLCAICGAGFPFTRELRAHLRKVHGEMGEGDNKEGMKAELLCRKGCGRFFYREYNRDAHEQNCKEKE